MTKSTILVVGSGGREHALAWKLSCSPQIGRVIVAPGNDGFSADWERWQVNLAGGAAEFEKLAVRAKEAGVRLAIIGPDNPLADGIVDSFRKVGVEVFGPSAKAARIEASKAFAKEVMAAAQVPTARFGVAASSAEAREFIRSQKDWSGWVVKADGLALGKGVKVCATAVEAEKAAEELLGVSGSLLIEERLSGEEISWLAFCDGDRCALMEPARDFKRVGDGDQGPNTGGMGAFSPVPGIDSAFAERVRREVFLPTLAEMKKRGCEFRGVLYAGLMVDTKKGKYWVLEFNARFGDPETQVLMARLEGDAFPWFEASAKGRLDSLPGTVPFSSDAAVVVVAAARGYPDSPERGRTIAIDESAEISNGALPFWFMAGVAKKDGKLVTAGGRVLGAVATGRDQKMARENAYARLKRVSFEGMQYRSDIAK